MTGCFKMILTDINKTYTSYYNLKVLKTAPILSDDNIIEPGETLVVPQITFLNDGGMHTPIKQHIIFGLANNTWITYDEIEN